MKKGSKKQVLDLSGLSPSPWWNRGVIDTFFQNVTGDPQIPENQRIRIVGTKSQFERLYQILKRIEVSED